MKQDLINRARRMTFALFAMSLSHAERSAIVAWTGAVVFFWNNAQVKQA